MIQARVYREGVDEPEVKPADPLPVPTRGALLWIDCNEPDDAELFRLAEHFGLHEFVLEDLEHGNQRTKLDHYAEQFHVAVHDCVLADDPPDVDPSAQALLVTREIDVVFGDGWLVSVRQPPDGTIDNDFPIDAVRRRFEAQRRQHDATDEGFLLWALLDVVVDRYFELTDAVDDRLDLLQAVVLDDTADRMRAGQPRELFAASKALLRFRRAALPLREVIGQLLRREDPAITDAALVHFQDLYDHVLRVADLVESQRDVLMGLRDADLAVVSNQMSLVQQRIAAWGAILIVATLVTGVLGMNFRNAPELDWETGFAAVAGVMVLAGVPMYAFFRWRKWL